MEFLHFMVRGGWGMWLVLACGLASLAQAISFGTMPTSAGRGAFGALSRATLLSIPAAIALSLAHMGAKIPNPELANNPRFDLVVIEGLVEALSAAILGFSILCFAWIIAALGERRRARSGSESKQTAGEFSRAACPRE